MFGLFRRESAHSKKALDEVRELLVAGIKTAREINSAFALALQEISKMNLSYIDEINKLKSDNEQKDGALRYNRGENISLLKDLRELRLILEKTQLEREAALKSNEDIVCENSKLKALNAGFSDTLEKLSVWYDKVRAERDSLLKRIEFREEYLQFSAENETRKKQEEE